MDWWFFNIQLKNHLATMPQAFFHVPDYYCQTQILFSFVAQLTLI